MVSKIGKGLMVLVCAERGDSEDDILYCAKKTCNLRIFQDSAGKMNLDVSQVGGEVLAISQFTLAADVRKGNRPSFVKAEEPDRAKEMVEKYCLEIERAGIRVGRGVFGAMMKIELVNDGPVTIIVDSKAR